MIPTDLEEIRTVLDGRWVGRSSAARIEGVSIDSRTARGGELFFAIRGEHFDGHDFLPAAAEAGCAGAVVSRHKPLADSVIARFPAGLIAVEDTTQALGDLAGHVRGRISARVVAVTGSNGKTTVKRMIHHILRRRLTGSCSPKSFNNEIGVPLTLLAVGQRDEYVVCEVGSNSLGEIAALGRRVRPDIAVITSVAETHLEKLGSLQQVAAEKASLLGSLAKRGTAIAWADSPELADAMRPYGREVVLFGESAAADLRLTGWERRGWGQRLEVNGRWTVDLPLPGRHNALNAMAAMAAARPFGLGLPEAAKALADCPGGQMRLERIEAGAITIINDAYNANPASFAAAADVFAGCQAKRKVLVAGDMLELGGQARDLHLATGRRLARCGADLLIGVGPLGRYIAMGAAEGGLPTLAFDSPAQACQAVAELLQPGDLVLIKGSRALELERLIEPIRRCPAAGGGRDDRPAAD